MAYPSAGPNLLQSLQVSTELVIQTTSQDLAVFSILHILLSGTLYYQRFCITVITHSTSRPVSSPALLLRSVHFLQHHTRAPLPHILNCSEGKDNLPSFIDAGVEESHCQKRGVWASNGRKQGISFNFEK